MKSEDWSEFEKRQLAGLVRKGSSVREISASLGRRVGSVKKMAQKMRLVLRKRAKKVAR
jgi:transposase